MVLSIIVAYGSFDVACEDLSADDKDNDCFENLAH